MNAYKTEIILANIEARKKEIAEYEINIFNYTFMANETLDSDERVGVLKAVEDNIVQMNKIKLVLRALEAQLSTLTN